MQLPAFDDFAHAYRHALTRVLEVGETVDAVEDSTSVGSEFGTTPRPTLELRPFGFRVDDPAACLIHCEARQPHVAYVVGQWLWVMRGSDQLDGIVYYNTRGRAFSDDGSSLYGAFGARMRAEAGDQLEAAVTLLRSDPATRRALIALSRPGDLTAVTRDRPCAISCHLLLRDGRLEAITSMRSQSALMVLPYDAALFMTIQVWVAATLGIQPGPHTWLANSFHLHVDEVPLARQVISGELAAVRLPHSDEPEASLSRLLTFEQQVRDAVVTGDRNRVLALDREAAPMDDLHDTMKQVLLMHAADRLHDHELRSRAARRLPSPWERCMRVSNVPAEEVER